MTTVGKERAKVVIKRRKLNERVARSVSEKVV